MTSQPQIIKEYNYEDQTGKLLYQVLRYEPKGFSQRRPDGNGGWIGNVSGAEKVLYKLGQLIRADLDEWIFITEGEKDADRISSCGFTATTASGGTGKWLESYNEYFRNRCVAILPDNDQPGRAHAQSIAESICDVAKSVKIIELPGLKDKGDVSDFLDAGHTMGEINLLVDDEPSYIKNESWISRAEVVSLDFVEPQEIDWLWQERIPLGMLTIIAGDPGVGKSFLSLYIASLVTTANPTPDNTIPAFGSVIILSAEDSLEHVIRPRLEALGADVTKIKAIRCVRRKDAQGNETTDHFNIQTDRFELERILEETPDVKLVIIDPLSAYFGSVDTHKDSNVRSVLAPLVEMAGRFNIALVCILHLNKGSSSKACYRTMGSLAFPAAARTVWLVSPEPGVPNSSRRLFIAAKHNILKEPKTLAFEIIENKVIFDNQPVDITADDVFANKGKREESELAIAIEFLEEVFQSVSSISAKEVYKLAKTEGYNQKTLNRAKKELGITSYRDDDEEGNNVWYWMRKRKEEDEYTRKVKSSLKQLNLPKLPNF
jgi:putative DNA primase/helicase